MHDGVRHLADTVDPPLYNIDVHDGVKKAFQIKYCKPPNISPSEYKPPRV